MVYRGLQLQLSGKFELIFIWATVSLCFEQGYPLQEQFPSRIVNNFQQLQLLRAACLQNEAAPEKLLNRYEKRFEKREKKIWKTIQNAS